MKKIAFIGAGSFLFTRNLARDILTFPAFDDVELALVDINSERLAQVEKAVNKLVSLGGHKAKVTATTDRGKGLDGADGVVSTILAGGVDVWRYDVEIPKKYGVDINQGDTRGPAGIFRALRTIPVMLDICRDIEKFCPRAILLNYSNPMAMLCRAMQGNTHVNTTGLCHSVQGTASMLARWIGAAEDEITYLCAGINHQAWYLEYKWKGEDAYPLIQKALEKPEIYREEIVRNEMYRHLGYYVTESSGHNSEYNAWFRKRQDLIEKYCHPGTGWNPGVYGYCLNEYLERKKTYQTDMEKWMSETPNLERGNEYAACIFNAIIGDGELYQFNGNVRNANLVDNLPAGCCVEVPVLVSRAGIRPMHVGPLPAHLAILTGVNAQCEELAVEGAITGDRRKIFHAICMDPLTQAVLSLEEIKTMVDEMFEANKNWLPQFKTSYDMQNGGIK
ncbi:alpha-glucosidase/alpha-galactosidase [Spirochaetia bacterium]|nr:alpha-glucosidase/alpha-galactosidase [Spirochaetia bacterium]